MAKTAAQLTREINEALSRRIGSGALPPYEGMSVTVTKYGAFHHNLRAGARGTIKRVSSPDVRHGTPTARARVLVEVDGSEVATDWPTSAFAVKGAEGTPRKGHATKKTSDVSVGDEVYAVSGGRRHGPGIIEEIYDDGSMRVDFTRQFAGRLRIRPEDLIAVPRGQKSRSHATTKVPQDWTARQMTSGRRVVEKVRGNKIARIFQGPGYWTVTLSRRDPRAPFETTGEIARQSAKTLAAAKSLGTRLLKVK